MINASKVFIFSNSRHLVKSGLLKNVLTLMTGTLFAQILSVAVSPILSRLYLPVEFGPFALYAGVLGITSVFAAMRYDLAIVVAKSNEDALNLLALACLLSIAAGCLLGIGSMFAGDPLLSLLKLKSIKNFLFIIAILTCISGIYQSLAYWFNRINQYRYITYSKLSESIVSATLAIGLGIGGLGSIGLVLGQAFGRIASLAALCPPFWRREKRNFSTVNLNKIKSQAYRHRNFPQYDLANALFYSLRIFTVLWMVGLFYDMRIVGLFAFAEKILIVPVGLLSNSVSQVFYSKLSTAYSTEHSECVVLIHKTFNALFLTTTMPFLLFVLTSKYYIPFVFGENWRELYSYVYALSPVAYLRLLVSPVAFSLKVVNKQYISLMLNGFAFIAIAFSIVASYFIGLSGYQSIVVVSLVTFLVICLNSVVILRFLKVCLKLPYYLVFFSIIAVYFVLFISAYGS